MEVNSPNCHNTNATKVTSYKIIVNILTDRKLRAQIAENLITRRSYKIGMTTVQPSTSHARSAKKTATSPVSVEVGRDSHVISLLTRISKIRIPRNPSSMKSKVPSPRIKERMIRITLVIWVRFRAVGGLLTASKTHTRRQCYTRTRKSPRPFYVGTMQICLLYQVRILSAN